MQLITTHANADFDALASMVAAKKCYPQAVAAFSGSQEQTVRDFLELFQSSFDIKKPKQIPLDKIDHLIIVDTKSPTRIGEFAELLKRKDLKIHIYDHHPFNTNDIRGEKEIIEEVGAAATIMTELLQVKGIAITPIEATLLATGIYEETGSLIYPSTTERDLKAAAYLLKRGANLNIVSSYINRELNREEVSLLHDLVQAAKDYLVHGFKITIAKAFRETYRGEIAFLTHKLKEFEDADALTLLVCVEGRTHIILRSRAPEIDVAEVAREFGGGGHGSASSATVKGATPDEIMISLVRVFHEKIKPQKRAKDIMTAPVKTIDYRSTIKEAESTLTKYEINVLPTLKDDKFYGLISREIVEKALFHGFGDAKVAEFCTTDAMFVSPRTPAHEIEAAMIEKHQRFMPVIEGATVKGAITRTDLLRTMYEDAMRKYRLDTFPIKKKSVSKRNLNAIMTDKFPVLWLSMLKLAGQAAEALEFSAYLVGGSVRDLLRGQANLDFDLVIEGDGIIFARALAEKINAKVKTHQRFRTATVITEALKLDVATARTEYYDAPGALPNVEQSSIKKDLYRRDFTINTLAIALNPHSFGQLLDFFGGQTDIKDKAIKALHSLSFIEDPTRAFRAVRFAERFGYHISKHTAQLIKIAIKMEAFQNVTGGRIYDELKAILRETEPSQSVAALDKLGLLKPLHPNLRLTAFLKKTLAECYESLIWFRLLFTEEALNRSELFMAVIASSLDNGHRQSLLSRLAAPHNAVNRILTNIDESQKALSALDNASSASKIYHALHCLTLESILLAMGQANNQDVKKKISLFLTELRRVKITMTGDELKRLGFVPGPVYKKIFNALLDAKLDGRVNNLADEIAFTQEHFAAEY
jgi:tRNA nucleotidyltransferase (CCA-adding enzyme)